MSVLQISTKFCVVCGLKKDVNEFRKKHNQCKTCIFLYNKTRRDILIKENKCVKCTKQFTEGHKSSSCDDCLLKKRERTCRLIENRKCIKCEKRIEENNNTIHCYNCLNKLREMDKKLKDNKQCRHCKKPLKIAAINTFCDDCLTKKIDRVNKLKKENKCIICAENIEEGNNTIHCFNCLQKIKEGTKKRRQKLSENNLCKDCGQIIDIENSKVYCGNCLKKCNERSDKRIKKLIIEHKCRSCSKEIEVGNKTIYCFDCLNRRKNNKLYTGINYKLRCNISAAIRRGLKQNSSSKNGESCLKYLPYTIEELKIHLEKLFEPWMNWNNHGFYKIDKWDDNDKSTWVWHIDHIIPQISFLYISMEDENFKKCWSLENLRPLSAKENIKKGHKIAITNKDDNINCSI